METQAIENLTQFGVAGLMGMLWLWERLYSRRREQQLTEAHDHHMAQHEELRVLTDLIRQNTAALERFAQTQARIAEALDRLAESRRVA